MNNETTPLNITKAEYLLSLVNGKNLPQPRLPEIAFIGRSNVGKSSLINSLARVRGLAKVSQSPGKTQTINYFQLNCRYPNGNDKLLYLVDLPGYGYAKTSKKNRQIWSAFTKDYFATSTTLFCVCLLIDLRHPPMDSDIAMFKELVAQHLPVLVIATKADKLTKNLRNKNLAIIRKTLQLPEETVLPYSSVDGTGRNELLNLIADSLQ